MTLNEKQISPNIVKIKQEIEKRMKANNITRRELSRRLEVQDMVVYRLLDPKHNSNIANLEKAALAVGLKLEWKITAMKVK